MRRWIGRRSPGNGAPRFWLLLGSICAASAIALAPFTSLEAQTLPPQANPIATTFVPACPGSAGLGSARCHALVRTDAGARPNAVGAPSGYAPADLQSAYAVAGLAAPGGATVAIVDAYDDPNAESDLAVYRAQFGLPSCTTANGCFRKVDQNGGTSYPNGNTGWAEEIALDLDMVSAICPSCKILLVEANSNSLANLGAAVNRAASMGAVAISNSYGTSGEYSGETSDESAYYKHSGIAVTASSGDSGYGVSFPAASQYVTAVGGTSLARASTTRGWSETAWSGAGSGCSAVIPKPSWQTDSGCSKRTVADVSAVANPSTGVAVYDTYGQSGWLVFGGTSVSAPIIASVYALGGHTSSLTYGSSPYGHTSSLYDVTTGKNGSCGAYLCTAGTGYDGPTGLGTPNGTGAFGGSGGGGGTGDATPPAVSITSPTSGATVSGTTTVTATASDNVGVVGVQFQLEGSSLGAEDTSSPYSASWNTATTTNGTHTLTAVARDAAGNSTTSSPVTVTVSNSATVTAPAAPSNLRAKAVGKSSMQINLSWSESSSNVTGYSIQRATSSDFSTGLTTLTSTTTSYSDKNLARSTTYYYRVAATGSGGTSAYSGPASAATR